LRGEHGAEKQLAQPREPKKQNKPNVFGERILVSMVFPRKLSRLERSGAVTTAFIVKKELL
jgi:hypothetical protein